jgi:hypothetical protein
MRRLPGPSARSEDHDGHLDDAPVTSPPGLKRSVSPRLRAVAEIVAAGAVYFVLACLIYWPVSPLDPNHLAGCACGDPEQQTWFLAWTSHAVTHGNNPFVTSYLHAPLGANLAIDTSMPLLGLLGIPITLTAGPVAAFNLLLRLGLAASGASMFGVLRRYTSWWPVAFGGGLLFAFSPYLANQAIRHLFLIFVPLVPLLIPIVDDWLISRRRTPLRSGLLLGLVAGAQFLISAEILLTSAIMVAVGLIYLALRYRAAVRERIGVLLRGAGAAIPVFVVIAGYPIYMLLDGPDRPVGALHTLSGLSTYHGDLLSPLYPTGHQLIAPASLASIGNSLPAGGTLENGFYLGFPLIILLAYLIVRCRRVPLVATMAVVGVVAFILGLGAKLTINGKSTGVPLPFAIFRHLPIVQNLEAARFSLYMQLAAAVIVAVGLDRVRAHGWWPAPAARQDGAPAQQVNGAGDGPPPPGDDPAPGGRGWARPATVLAVGLIAILPLLPNLPLPTAATHTPAYFKSKNVLALPSGALALTLPYGIAPQNDALMWQAASGMRFRILGGDAFVPQPDGRTTWHWLPAGPNVLLRVLRTDRYSSSPPPPASQAAASAVRQMIARYHVSVVLVDRAARYGPALSALVRRALGVPPRQHGRMDVWLDAERDLGRQPG